MQRYNFVTIPMLQISKYYDYREVVHFFGKKHYFWTTLIPSHKPIMYPQLLIVVAYCPNINIITIFIYYCGNNNYCADNCSL